MACPGACYGLCWGCFQFPDSFLHTGRLFIVQFPMAMIPHVICLLSYGQQPEECVLTVLSLRQGRLSARPPHSRPHPTLPLHSHKQTNFNEPKRLQYSLDAFYILSILHYNVRKAHWLLKHLSHKHSLKRSADAQT